MKASRTFRALILPSFLIAALVVPSCDLFDLVTGKEKTGTVNGVSLERKNPTDPDSTAYTGEQSADADGDGTGDYNDLDEIVPVTPANAADVTDVIPVLKLKVKSPTLISGYVFRIARDQAMTDVAFSETSVKNTCQVSTDKLTFGVTYYWDAGVTPAGGGDAKRSSPRTFTMKNASLGTDPVYPANGGTTAASKPALDWPDTAGATSYHVQLSENSSFSALTDENKACAASGCSPSVTLEHKKSYVWRYRFQKDSAWSAWSPSYSFTVNLNSVDLESPADNAAVSSVTPTFTWKANAAAASYILYIDDENTFAEPLGLKLASLTGTSRTLTTALKSVTKYYWKMAFKDANGVQGDFSDTRSFTTPYSDAEIVAFDKAALTIGYASGDSASSVTRNLTLPSTGANGCSITWGSSNTVRISNAGIVARTAVDTNVTLTATLTKGSTSDTKQFTLTVAGRTAAAPNISPDNGSYSQSVSVSISCPEPSDASIYYTTDGDVPTTDSTLYSSPITIASDKTVKAIAVKSDWTTSGVASKSYQIKDSITVTPPPAVTITFDESGFPSFSKTLGTKTVTATVSTAHSSPAWFLNGENLNTASDAVTITLTGRTNGNYSLTYTCIAGGMLYSKDLSFRITD